MSTSKRENKAKTVRGQILLDAALAAGGHRGQDDSTLKNNFNNLAGYAACAGEIIRLEGDNDGS